MRLVIYTLIALEKAISSAWSLVSYRGGFAVERRSDPSSQNHTDTLDAHPLGWWFEAHDASMRMAAPTQHPTTFRP